jgi:hypothetical protein
VVYTSVVTREVTVVCGFATLTRASQVECKKAQNPGPHGEGGKRFLAAWTRLVVPEACRRVSLNLAVGPA